MCFQVLSECQLFLEIVYCIQNSVLIYQKAFCFHLLTSNWVGNQIQPSTLVRLKHCQTQTKAFVFGHSLSIWRYSTHDCTSSFQQEHTSIFLRDYAMDWNVDSLHLERILTRILCRPIIGHLESTPTLSGSWVLNYPLTWMLWQRISFMHILHLPRGNYWFLEPQRWPHYWQEECNWVNQFRYIHPNF